MYRMAWHPLAAAAMAAVTLALAGGPAVAELAGTPTILDGDTIELDGQVLHLQGIDAPELGQQCTIKGQAYDCGLVSRTALMDLTAGTPVVCTLAGRRAGGQPADEDEGAPALCSADGYDLSEGMTYTGWALVERAAPAPEAARYAARVDGARQARRGLWRGRFIAPWAWRTGARLGIEDTAQ